MLMPVPFRRMMAAAQFLGEIERFKFLPVKMRERAREHKINLAAAADLICARSRRRPAREALSHNYDRVQLALRF